MSEQAHILLVDDDPDLLRLLTIRLKAGNYRVTAVGSAEAALARLAVELPALEMVSHLVSAQEATARTARRLFPLLEKANDQPTADLITQRLDLHEKTAWMLRSLLEE